MSYEKKMQVTFDKQFYHFASSSFISYSNQLNMSRNSRLFSHFDILRDFKLQREKDYKSILRRRNKEAKRTTISTIVMKKIMQAKDDLTSISTITSISRARYNAIVLNHHSIHAIQASNSRMQNSCSIESSSRSQVVIQKSRNTSLINESTIEKSYNINHVIIAFRYQV